MKVAKKAPNCRRFRAILSYDGARFHGWQKQGKTGSASALRTVEGVLELCLRPAFGQGIKFWPAGRTDAGTSAKGQVVQFDAMLSPCSPTIIPAIPKNADITERARLRAEAHLLEARIVLVAIAGKPTPPQHMTAALNALLPSDVRLLEVQLASRTFSAMAEVRWKRYVYTFGRSAEESLELRRSIQSDFAHRCRPAARVRSADSEPAELNVERMRAAARLLVGTHNFAAFQASGGRVHTVRTVYLCDIDVHPDGTLSLITEGTGFLYKMVRMMAAAVASVGMGLDPIASIEARLSPDSPVVKKAHLKAQLRAAHHDAPEASKSDASESDASDIDPSEGCTYSERAVVPSTHMGLPEVNCASGLNAPVRIAPQRMALDARFLCLEHVEYELEWAEAHALL